MGRTQMASESIRLVSSQSKRPVSEVLWGPAGWLAVFVLGLSLAACGKDEPGTVSAEAQSAEGRASLVDVVAGPADGGWLILRDAESSRLLVRTAGVTDDEDGVELPAWTSAAGYGTADGGLFIAGIGCGNPDDCESTVVEVVSGTGDLSDLEQRERFDLHGGEPRDSDSVRIVGEQDGSVWVDGVGSELLLLSPDGDVGSRVQTIGDPCVVAGRLHTIEESNPSLSEDGPVAMDPNGGSVRTLTVSVLGDGGFVPVADGVIVTDDPGVARCMSDGFELSVTGATDALRWTPTNGWSSVERVVVDSDAVSSHAVGSRHDEFVVDSAGELWTLTGGVWQETTVSFDVSRPESSPPLALFADSNGKEVLACLDKSPTAPEELGSVDCATGGVR